LFMLMDSARRLFQIGVDKTLSLLAPRLSVCFLCQRSYRPDSSNHLHGKQSARNTICKACRDKIPWITRIYCPVCGRPEQCGDCRLRSDTAFICNRSAVHYSEEIREWLAMYKYRGHEALAPLLGELLFMAYHQMMHELSQRNPSFRFHALIPVPISEQRLQERGFNQAEQLAAVIEQHSEVKVVPVLERQRHSNKQSHKSRIERMQDVRQLFGVDRQEFEHLLGMVNKAEGEKALSVLIVDDIYTTGSTLNACAIALQQHISSTSPGLPIAIYGLTLARS